jgi:ABC-2 type transport system permease protein
MRAALIDARTAWADLAVLAGWAVLGTVLTARTFTWE